MTAFLNAMTVSGTASDVLPNLPSLTLCDYTETGTSYHAVFDMVESRYRRGSRNLKPDAVRRLKRLRDRGLDAHFSIFYPYIIWKDDCP